MPARPDLPTTSSRTAPGCRSSRSRRQRGSWQPYTNAARPGILNSVPRPLLGVFSSGTGSGILPQLQSVARQTTKCQLGQAQKGSSFSPRAKTGKRKTNNRLTHERRRNSVFVRALDAQTGSFVWEDQFELARGNERAFAMAVEGERLVVAGTRSSPVIGQPWFAPNEVHVYVFERRPRLGLLTPNSTSRTLGRGSCLQDRS
jgi:hypothetical protein